MRHHLVWTETMVLAHPCRNFQHFQSLTQPHKLMKGRVLRNDSELSQPTSPKKMTQLVNMLVTKVIDGGHTTDNILTTEDSMGKKPFSELILQTFTVYKLAELFHQLNAISDDKYARPPIKVYKRRGKKGNTPQTDRARWLWYWSRVVDAAWECQYLISRVG